MWVTPENEPPRRPFIHLTVSQAGKVRACAVTQDAPTPDETLESIAQAISRPMLGGGRKRRPAVICLDDQALVDALAPLLEQVGVRCRYRRTLREIDRALSSMERFMYKREPILGLLRSPGVTSPLIHELFEAAGFFYREAPWRWISDSCPIEVCYPPGGPPRYAVVMGNGGQTYGLAVYNSPDELLEVYDGAPFDALLGEVEWTSLLFCEVTDVPFDDLDDIERYGWPVTEPDGYPVPLRVSQSGHPFRPGKSEVLWLEAALLAIPPFVRDHMQADRGLPVEANATLAVTTAGGEAQVHLRFPAADMEIADEDLWFDDLFLPPEVEAACERNVEIIDAFEAWLDGKGLSEKTVQRHLSNAQFFADEYMALQGGNAGVPRSAEQADRMDVDDYASEWFLENVRWLSVTKAKASIAALKKLYVCLKESGRMETEKADEVLDLLKAERGRYIELAQEYVDEEENLLVDWLRRMGLDA
jgi:hypothetical protein